MVAMTGRWLCFLRGLSFALMMGWGSVQASPPELDGEALIAALRGGGHTIYFRHAATDWSQQDRVERAGDWTSCDPRQIRQLSEQGRSTARKIGAAMRALRIPVGEVLASPYCRTVETAELLGLAPVMRSDAVINMRVASFFGGRDAVVATAQGLLASAPLAGINRVVVAHGNVERSATPVYPDEAEAVVFRPNVQGGFDFVGRLSPADWTALSKQLHGTLHAR